MNSLRATLRLRSSQLPTRASHLSSPFSHSSQLAGPRIRQSYEAYSIPITAPSRSFSLTRGLSKGQKNRKHSEDTTEQETPNGPKSSQSVDPAAIAEALDLTILRAETRRIQEKLRKNLSVLKPGGQFGTVFIETLRVDISKLLPKEPSTAPVKSHAKETKVAWVKNDPSTHDQNQHPDKAARISKKKATARNYQERPPPPPTVPLKEVAQVIPRGGKSAIIMLNEEDFAKPVTSALLSSPYSLNPQPSAHNPLELIVPIPPPSAEIRQWNVGQVDKYLERAESDLREGRAEMQKTLRALSVGGQMGPDAHRKTQKDMEKMVDDAKGEYKKICDAARKALL